MKFKLISGAYHRRGLSFEAGAIIESDTDLCEVFPNKFQRVTEGDVTAGVPLIKTSRKLAIPQAQTAKDLGPVRTVAQMQAAKPAPAPAAPAPAPVEAAQPVKAEELKSKLGANVTVRFPEAGSKGLAVFRRGNEFFVTKTTAPDEALNKKGLKKGDVEDFLKDPED